MTKKPVLDRFLLFLIILLLSVNCEAQKNLTPEKSDKNKSVDIILKSLCEEASKKDSLRQINARLEKQILSWNEKKDSLVPKKMDSAKVEIRINAAVIKNIEQNLEHLKQLLQTQKSELENSYKLSFKGVEYQIYIHSDTSNPVRLHHKDSLGKIFHSIANVRKDLLKAGNTPLMITNAGMYTVQNNPEGLYIEDGNELFPIDTDSSKTLLNFYMHPNGVFYIDSLRVPHVCSTQEYLALAADSTFKPLMATQSGPMLKINGAVHPRFNWGSTSRKIRSGVGIYEGMSVFVITRGYSNFYDFASFFTEVFECDNALFLDGAISLMYDPKLSPKELGGNFGPIISVSHKK